MYWPVKPVHFATEITIISFSLWLHVYAFVDKNQSMLAQKKIQETRGEDTAYDNEVQLQINKKNTHQHWETIHITNSLSTL